MVFRYARNEVCVATLGILHREKLSSKLELKCLEDSERLILCGPSALSLASPFLAVHAFAVGGVGLATIGMMSRVSLGHSGRNIRNPPKLTTFALCAMVLGFVVRVGFPLFAPQQYLLWVALSQALWIAAFSLFLLAYFSVLVRPRIDGQPG